MAGKFDSANLGFLYSQDKAPAPRANFYIARGNLDVGQDNTLGIIGVERDQAGSYDRAGGIDGRFRWSDIYTASFQGLGSHASNPDDSTQSGKAVFAQITRNTHTLATSLSYTDIDPSFRADTGFIPRTDIRNPAASASYYSYIEKPWFTRWGPQASYSRIYDHTGGLTDEAATASLYFEGPTWNSSISASPQNLEEFNGTNFRKNSYSANLNTSPSDYINGGISGTIGQDIHFSAPIELGNTESLSASVNLRPIKSLRLETVLFESELREKISNFLLSNQETYRETVRFQLTKEWSFRAITDWTRIVSVPPPSSRILTLSFLSSYILYPGTAVYVGYDVIRQSQDYGSWSLQDQTLFIKLSYLLRY